MVLSIVDLLESDVEVFPETLLLFMLESPVLRFIPVESIFPTPEVSVLSIELLLVSIVEDLLLESESSRVVGLVVLSPEVTDELVSVVELLCVFPDVPEVPELYFLDVPVLCFLVEV